LITFIHLGRTEHATFRQSHLKPSPLDLGVFLNSGRNGLVGTVANEPLVMTTKIVATINSTGRQAASFIRAASAVGWHVRAQIRNREGLVAEELATLPNVEIVEGDLTGPERPRILTRLFNRAKIAFINTTHWGDEVAIGKACADAAKKAGVAHYVYSSMPDHSSFDEGWRALPMWASKFAIENYVRQLGISATFVYTGIYNNNFTVSCSRRVSHTAYANGSTYNMTVSPIPTISDGVARRRQLCLASSIPS
jgi:uncharacterized protein YbjT (DUF2867 family)